MFRLAGILFCGALLFLAGCATQPSGPPPGQVVVGKKTAVSSPLNWTNPASKYLAPPPAPKPVMHAVPTNRPPVVFSPPVAPEKTWLSLRTWAAAHQIGTPHRLTDLPMVEYALGSKNGVMVLEIGSHVATWNGTQIYLGFAPALIDGEVFLNSLDLQKNLEPLLCEPPLVFGTKRVIVIDPGHGGSNTGAQSALDGRFEKEFTLDWAGRLASLLASNGWTVLLTRNRDEMVSNSDRVTFTTACHADLFISLHFNAVADRDKQAAGLEIYCLTPTGMPSTVTRGYDDILSEVLPGNAHDAQNLQLAVRVQTALLRATGMQDRGVRRSRFITVLRGQQCPAILIEGGFLSNSTEAKKIENPAFRQKLAEAVAAALK